MSFTMSISRHYHPSPVSTAGPEEQGSSFLQPEMSVQILFTTMVKNLSLGVAFPRLRFEGRLLLGEFLRLAELQCQGIDQNINDQDDN